MVFVFAWRVFRARFSTYQRGLHRRCSRLPGAQSNPLRWVQTTGSPASKSTPFHTGCSTHTLGYNSVRAVVDHDIGSPVAGFCALVHFDLFERVVLMSAGRAILHLAQAVERYPASQRSSRTISEGLAGFCPRTLLDDSRSEHRCARGDDESR